MKWLVIFMLATIACVGCRPSGPNLDKNRIRELCAKMSRTKPETYREYMDGYTFVIANHKEEQAANGGTICYDATIPAEGFFVLPSGVWVKTPEDVIKTVKPVKIQFKTTVKPMKIQGS